MDVACVKDFLLYNMMHQNNLNLLDYKAIVSTHSICWWTNRNRPSSEERAGSKKKH